MSNHERRRPRTLTEKVRVAVPLVMAWGVGLAVMATVAGQTTERAGQLLMDPSFTLGTQWYTGLVSNLGILAWTVGAAAAFAGAWLCRMGGRARAGRFLFGGGVVGALLLLDDLFQFHSVLLTSELNVPKLFGELLLAVPIAWWVGRHLRETRRTHAHLLIAAAAGLGLSFVVDAVYRPLPGVGWNVIEDGAKFLGILAWSTYFVVTTRDISRSVFIDALLTWPDEAYEGLDARSSGSAEGVPGTAGGPGLDVSALVPDVDLDARLADADR